jgi:hypothetical protein
LFVVSSFELTKPIIKTFDSGGPPATVVFHPFFAVGPTKAAAGGEQYVLFPLDKHLTKEAASTPAQFVYRTKPAWWSEFPDGAADLGGFDLVWLTSDPVGEAGSKTITKASFDAAKPLHFFDDATAPRIQRVRPAGVSSFVSIVGRYPEAVLGLKTAGGQSLVCELPLAFGPAATQNGVSVSRQNNGGLSLDAFGHLDLRWPKLGNDLRIASVFAVKYYSDGSLDYHQAKVDDADGG